MNFRQINGWQHYLTTEWVCEANEWMGYDTLLEPLHWRHNGRDSISNHRPHDCLLKRLFRRRSKKTSKLRVTGLCEGISPVTGEFPAQRASNAENVSIWRRHHDEWISPSPITHWDRVTNICVGRLTIIVSDNGLSPERRQALIWNNVGIWLIGPLGTISVNFNRN